MTAIATLSTGPWIAALAAVCLLALAGSASWGPGTHIQLTQEVLRRFRRRASLNEGQRLALENPQAFLYGNIAADIINFKAFGGVKNHCHNWNIHERLEAQAESEGAGAFILGYLCHLSADIVAHNHFVPYHCVFSFPPRLLGHAYWEAMADGRVSDAEWQEIDALKQSRAIHAFDRLVHRAVRHRALGLRSNKWIFNNILLFSSRQRWRRFIQGVQASARKHPLDEAFYLRCRRASFRNMLAVFHPKRLAVLKAHDPTGRAALLGALRLRRELLTDFRGRVRAREISRELARAAFGKL